MYYGRDLAMEKNPIYLGGSANGLKVRPARQRTGIFALAKWGRDVEVTYPLGDLVYAAIFQPGSRVWAVVVATPESGPGSISASIYLEPNGDGRLKVSTEPATRYQAMSGAGFSYYTDRSTGAIVHGIVPRVETFILGG